MGLLLTGHWIWGVPVLDMCAPQQAPLSGGIAFPDLFIAKHTVYPLPQDARSLSTRCPHVVSVVASVCDAGPPLNQRVADWEIVSSWTGSPIHWSDLIWTHVKMPYQNIYRPPGQIPKANRVVYGRNWTLLWIYMHIPLYRPTAQHIHWKLLLFIWWIPNLQFWLFRVDFQLNFNLVMLYPTQTKCHWNLLCRIFCVSWSFD